MTGIYQTRTSRAAWLGMVTARFSLVLLAVAALAHRYGLVGTPDFLRVYGAVALLAVTGLLLAAIGFRRVWRRGDEGGGWIAAAALFGLLGLSPVLSVAVLSNFHPEIHDVATDLADPPPLMRPELPADGFANPAVPISPADAAKITAAYPEATGRRYEVSVDRVAETVTALMAERGWPVTGQRGVAGQDAEMIIFGRAETLALRFASDVSVRMTDEGATTFVDMRSASRYGRYDFGRNASWIIAFLAELDLRIATGHTN